MSPTPPLEPGTVLGGYTLGELLGVGGMGEVYRARDPKLLRDVALKVLPEEFSKDPDRVQRFEREARLLASLNHPNIAAIYGFERLEGRHCLVLEFIDGETLDVRLRSGPLPLGKVVEIALQIAEALEEAHGKGIIHRDLKPANIKLSPKHTAKVLDFGLAKSLDEPANAALGLGGDTTQSGTVLGTVGYMSPEQVRGRAVDPRADIWAFGCVLYEMLTGARAFERPSPSDTYAAILREEPDWTALPPETPDALRRLLRRCLQKDPRARLQHIGDARLEITDWLDGLPHDAYRGEEKRGTRSLVARLVPWLVGGLTLLVALVAGWRALEREARPRETIRLTVAPPEGLRFPAADGCAPSPDGLELVCVGESRGQTHLFQRRLADLSGRVIPGTEGARQPFFSPDGRSVAFFADGELRRVDLDGDRTAFVADANGESYGGSWGGGEIVFASSARPGLVRVAETGGEPVPLTRLDVEHGERSHRWPQIVGASERETRWSLGPLGGSRRAVIFTAEHLAPEAIGREEPRRGVHVVPLDGDAVPKKLLENAERGRVLPNGHLVFSREGSLRVARYDERRLEAAEASLVVVPAVARAPRGGTPQFEVSPVGTLVYRIGAPPVRESRPTWTGEDGVDELVEQARRFTRPRLSPDGRRLLLEIESDREADLWILDVRSRSLTRLTYGGAHSGVWSPDGSSVVHAGPEVGTLSRQAIGDTQGRSFWSGEGAALPSAFTADGRTLVFQRFRAGTGWDILALDLAESSPAGSAESSPAGSAQPRGEPRELVATAADDTAAVLSHDGRWLAYQSKGVGGREEVWITGYPSLGRRWQISQGGGLRPLFDPRGGRLFYWHTGRSRLEAVAFETAGGAIEVTRRGPAISGSVSLWQADHLGGSLIDPASSGYDYDPVSDRFLLLRPVFPEVPERLGEMVVIVDWLNELGSG